MASTKPSPGTVFHEAGSQASLDDLIAAQDRARQMNESAASTARSWAPWVIGGLVLAGIVYYVKRD